MVVTNACVNASMLTVTLSVAVDVKTALFSGRAANQLRVLHETELTKSRKLGRKPMSTVQEARSSPTEVRQL